MISSAAPAVEPPVSSIKMGSPPRKDAFKTIGRVAASVSLLIVLACGDAQLGWLQAMAAIDEPPRPNIVWLVSEDNSKHFLKLFDDGGAETPHIEALARDGLVFRHAFSNAPVCSVARTTLMSGCYAPRIMTQFHRPEVRVPLPDDLHLFPYYLRQAGYYTSNRRKTDYNVRASSEVWDESSGQATWRNRRENQPFFHMQSFPTSHESRLHFPAEDVVSMHTHVDPATVKISPKHPDTDLFRYTYARYHEQIRKVDEQIGEVIEQLREEGLLEQTWVFYFGDHGGVLPGSKGFAYEVGLHVPLVVRVPEKFRGNFSSLPAMPGGGQAVDGFVSFVDFAPTALRLAGVAIPDEMNGQAFLGPEVDWAEVNRRQQTLGYADRFDEKADFVRTLRRGRFKYVRSFWPFTIDGLQNNYRYKMAAYRQWRERFTTGRLNDVQRQFFEPRAAEALYDMEHDPYETKNLAGNPQHRETLLQLRESLNDHLRSWPDLSFFPEAVLVDQAANNPTQFGRQHQAEIGRLLDTANLQLGSYREQRTQLAEALRDPNPWIRYWGIIAATSWNSSAEDFVPAVRLLAEQDPERLVRMRAWEFLELVGGELAAKPLIKELEATTKPVEAAMLLNTLALLHDRRRLAGDTEDFPEIDRGQLHESILKNDSVQRRLEYLGSR